MNIIIGTDHRGFKLKEQLKSWLQSQGRQVKDVGAHKLDPDDDFVDYAIKAVNHINDSNLGILICGSGHGMDMAANRYPHIRAIVGFNQAVVEQGRSHEAANVLVLPSNWISFDHAKKFVHAFIDTEFSGKKRYQNRLDKLNQIK